MESTLNFTIHNGKNHSEIISDFYHLCSEGTREDVLFHHSQEFMAGMNLVALTAATVPVKILAFCLMDNHFHFILKATAEAAKAFAVKMSRCYGLKFKHSHQAEGVRQDIKWEALPITDERYLLNSIAYVMNNPVKAGYGKCRTDYPWSGNSLYFRETGRMEEQERLGQRIADIPIRQLKQQIRSYKSIPPYWIMTQEGYIWPGSYVDWRMVEQFYGNVDRMEYFLHSKRENEETALSLFRYRLTISDEEVRTVAVDLAEKMFRVVEIKTLDVGDRTTLARHLIRKTGCRQEQVYRILHLKRD